MGAAKSNKTQKQNMKLLKRFWPILFIVFIWLIFSSPYLFQNKVPFPSRYLVNFFSPWASYPSFVSPVKNNAMPDVISQIYPWKTLTIDSLKELSIPLWNPYSFSGTPHLANYQSAVLSPFNLLFFILPFIDAWSISVLVQPLLAGLFMFYFLKTLKISKNASLIGSISFMFCGFIVTWMAYATLPYAILFLPLSLFAIEKYLKSFRYRYLILLSITFPLSFFSGHFQISLYFLIFVFSYLVFKSFQVKNFPAFINLFFFSFIGIFLSLPQLLPSIELYPQSLRSAIFQKLEAIPLSYFPTIIAPDLFGNPVTRNDWFGHYAEWNAYIGVIPAMLSLYAFLMVRKKTVLFFVLTAAASILFSFQTPFLDFLVFLKIPVLSTSAASRLIVILSFSAAVLAAFGFEELLSDISKKNKKRIFYFLLIFLAVFSFMWISVVFKLFLPTDKLLIAKQNLILPTIIFLSLFFLTAITIFVKDKKNFLVQAFSILVIIIVTLDLLRFANKWMPFDSRNLVYPKVPVSWEFKKISGFERVLGSLGGEASIYYRLPALVGYDAVYIKRYGEFIASLETGKLSQSPRSVVSLPINGLYTPKAINLLGTKYLVNKKSDGRAVWNFPYWTYPSGTFKTNYEDDYYQIFENTKAFPRAFLVNKYIVENDPQKILNVMFSSDFDLRNQVVLEEKVENLSSSSSGLVKIVNYTFGKVSLTTSSSGKSLLFLSDTYYPGWEAFIDGKNTKIYRADYTFRAIVVPKGSHKVDFVYNPISFKLGVLGFGVGFILLSYSAFLRGKLLGIPKFKLR